MPDEVIDAATQTPAAGGDVTPQTPEGADTSTPVDSGSSADPWNGIRDAYLSKFTDDKEKESVGKWLGRYATPLDVLDAARKVNDQFKRGELRLTLPKNATEEQIKAYREANDIPENAAAYLEKLPDGLVVGDADKPVFEAFAETLAKDGHPKAVIHSAIKWYNEWSEKQSEALVQAELEADAQFKAETEKQLQEMYGGEVKLNLNMANNWIASLGEEVAAKFREARTADGRLFFNDPVIVHALVNAARQANPTGTLVSGSGERALQQMDEEIAGYEKEMQTNRDKWFAADNAARRDRYGKLLEAKEKYK